MKDLIIRAVYESQLKENMSDTLLLVHTLRFKGTEVAKHLINHKILGKGGLQSQCVPCKYSSAF